MVRAMGGDSQRAQAVIVSASRSGGSGEGPDSGEATAFDAVTDHLLGGDRWDLVLEVTLPTGARFEHAGRYTVANRLGGLRKALKRWTPVPGLVVPVVATADRRTVDIDWKAFVRSGGIERAVELGRQLAPERAAVQGAAATGAMLATKPKMAAKQRELALAHGPEMADQVIAGVRPAREFSQYISGLVQGGALTEQEGSELLARAGIGP